MTISFSPGPARGSGTPVVRFYESDAFLASLLADFVTAGVAAGEPVIVIASDLHRDAVVHQLGVAARDVTFLGVDETLATFMNGALPDAAKFTHAIGSLLGRSIEGRTDRRVRVFGEMIDALWKAGNPEGAIRLEELWNELAAEYTFSLLRAYPMGNFVKETDAALDAIGTGRSDAAPAERSASSDDDELVRELAALQQRTAALEAEVAHRRELERALRDALAARSDAESELADFVENATIGLHRVGPDGIILWANDAEMKLLGYARDEYIGRPIADFHADRATIDDILTRLGAGEELHDYEARLRAKDGTIRHVAISSNVRFANGQFAHTRCFTRDVSDRKRLEVERAFLLEASTLLNGRLSVEERLAGLQKLVVPRLADRCTVDLSRIDRETVEIEDGGARLVLPLQVADRTLGTIEFAYATTARRYTDADLPLALELARRAAMAIDNARLYELACEANRAKDDFLATLSHELRTPLTAILGWARLMLLGGLDAETTRMAIETIERSARAQSALIDDLLDLSRVVTGKLTLTSELLDLAGVAGDAAQTVMLAAESKGIHIDVNAAAGRALVMGDATRMQQVVWNLIANAVKFSETGDRVWVSVEADAATVRIVVRDEGHGIAPSFLPHVFEPFRQADPGATRCHGGLGLGLAIVKYLVEMHGGTVSAASEGEGRGATFVVTLPLAVRAIVTTPVAAESFADLRGMSVLLVDDDDATRQLVETILGRCGADVRAASSVDVACESLATHLPDVVVTDIAMPEQDGFTLLARLRAHGGQDIPVVALTAITATEERFRSAGFQAYVRKPVDPTRFARVVAGLRR